MSDSSLPGLATRTPVGELAPGLAGFIAAVAGASTPRLGGGSVAAAAGAVAAALAQMVAGLTVGRPKYAPVAGEMQNAAQRAAALATELSALVERDAAACDAVATASRLPKAVGDASLTRYGALQRALITATETPLAIAHAAADVAVLSADIAERGNVNAVADAAVATIIAESVSRAAALTVRVNAVALADTTIALRFKKAVDTFAQTAGRAAGRALAAAERES